MVKIHNQTLQYQHSFKRAEQVRGQLHIYFKKPNQSSCMTKDLGIRLPVLIFWLLYVLSLLQDLLFKEWSLNMQESIITQQFSDASQYSRVNGDIMEYLERIAFMRFALEKTADIMYNNVSINVPISQSVAYKCMSIYLI